MTGERVCRQDDGGGVRRQDDGGGVRPQYDGEIVIPNTPMSFQPPPLSFRPLPVIPNGVRNLKSLSDGLSITTTSWGVSWHLFFVVRSSE